VVRELKDFGVNVEVIDPHADSDELKHEYGFGLVPAAEGKYDACIVAVNHSAYLSKTDADFAALLHTHGIVADLKGVFRGKLQSVKYWSL